MKRIFIIITLCLIFFKEGYASVVYYNNQKKVVTTVTGYFPLFKDSVATIFFDTWDESNKLSPKTSRAIQMKNGRFTVNLSIDHVISMSVTFKDEFLFNPTGFAASGIPLFPGDNIEIVLNKPPKGASFKDVSFDGNSSKKYTMYRDVFISIDAQPDKPTSREISKMATGDWFNYLGKRMDIFESVMAKFPDVGEPIKEIYRAKFTDANYHGCFDGRHAQQIENATVRSEFENKLFTNKYVGNLRSGNLARQLLKYSGIGLFVSRAKLGYFIKRNMPYDVNYFFFNKAEGYRAISEYFAGSPFKEEIEGAFFIFMLKGFGLKEFGPSSKQYLKENKQVTSISTQLTSLLQTLESNIAAGKDAYNFSLTGIDGKKVRMQDFKGKVVVMDFMFNGCVGCRLMAPVLEEIEQTFKGQEIAFVSVSIDRTKELWMKGIGKFSSPSSIQLYTDGLAADNPIISHYKIISYPTLMVFDKMGKVIAGRAPDPRGDKDKLVAMLQSALK